MARLSLQPICVGRWHSQAGLSFPICIARTTKPTELSYPSKAPSCPSLELNGASFFATNMCRKMAFSSRTFISDLYRTNDKTYRIELSLESPKLPLLGTEWRVFLCNQYVSEDGILKQDFHFRSVSHERQNLPN